MTRAEFNKLVTKAKKEILKGDAQTVFNLLETQYLYRNGGIEGNTFDKILTEIAQAEVLDVDLVDCYDINTEIKNL